MTTNSLPPNTLPTIVALCGAKRHGKGTAARGLIENHDFVQVDFADALRRCCAEAFGIPLEIWYDDTRKESDLAEYGYPGETVRSLLITVGTDLMRSKWKNIWVNTWRNVAMQHQRVVCTDLRFPNELDAVRNLGALVMRVVRPDGPPIDYSQEPEMYQDKFLVDETIINDGTENDLMKRATARANARLYFILHQRA